MRTPVLLLTFVFIGCTSNPTPDQVRHDTAAATATVVSDVKAGAQGIKEGLHQQAHPAPPPIDINTATRPNLEVLPGITPPLARRIIAHRPYATTAELRTKHVLTQPQFDAISTHISTTSNL